MATEKIKYIDGNIKNGIEYDWKKIIKECRKLGVPPEVVVPWDYPFTRAKYFVVFNERSTGKTTNWILLGMVLNRMYDSKTIYVRQIIDMILPKNAKSLLKTILEFDYITKITDGKYNSARYNSRGFYYINTLTDEIAPEEFIHLVSIDDAQELKSVFNEPRGDLIIFDEFISRYTRPDEFVDFEDLVKTIIRDRYSPIVVMLANTIDPYNIYFKELEVYEEVQSMRAGESKIVVTDMGTHIFLHYPKDGKDVIVKERHNSTFFGFKNKKLNAITGGGWATNSYQHLPRGSMDNKIIILNNRYIDFNGKLIKLDVIQSDIIGVCVSVHDISGDYNDLPCDAIVYTYGDIIDKRYRYLFGYSELDKRIWRLYSRNKFYYAHNQLGEMVSSYVAMAKKLVK